jgi:uncharacterized membrane protein
MTQNLLQAIKSKRAEITVTLIFLLIYCLVSFVNHINFRTSSLDLGMFNQALYSFSHGKMNYFTLDLSGKNPMYFADHFSPLTLLYTPFYFIFGSWTLLIVQIASIIFGAIGCYKVARLKIPTMKSKWLVLLFFFAQWAIISALAYDFHNNVVAAMLIPWFFYYHLTKRPWAAVGIFLLVLIAKENMALWMFFILAGMVASRGFKAWKENLKSALKFEIPLMLVSLVYFYVVVSKIMPMLSQGEALNQIARFGKLGNSIPEIAKNVLLHPIDTFKLLFWSQLTDPLSYGIKKELHLVVFFSGGFALIMRPAYLLMLVPIYAQKLFSDNMGMWGINGQYSIEYTPIIALAMIDLAVKLKTDKQRLILWSSAGFLAVLVNFITLKERTSFWYEATTHDFMKKSHYDSGRLNIGYANAIVNAIPENIPVSSSPCFGPRLANREKLYHFPVIQDAEVIVLIQTTRSTYPVNPEQQAEIVKQLIDSKQFRVRSNKHDILVLERIATNKPTN